MSMCIRCGDRPPVDDMGYCGKCHWAVRTEIESGFAKMNEYLRPWAAFSEWERKREPREL